MDLDLKYLTHTFESGSLTTIGQLALGGWDLPRIRGARDGANAGRFVMSAGFGQAAKSDGRVFSAWAQRCGPPLSLPRSVSAPKGTEGDELTETARAEGEALFAPTSLACPPRVFATVFERLPFHGFTWLQNIWTPRADGSRIDVRVEPWPIQATWYNVAKGCYMANTRDGAQEMRHGDGKWTAVEPYGVQSYLSGAVFPLCLLFADRGWSIRDASNFSGAHGSPGLVGNLPPDEAPEGKLGLAYLAEMAKLQQPRARMVEPHDAKTRYIEPLSQNYQIFGANIDRDASDIAMVFLGQDGTSKNEGGTYTKALVLQGVLYDYVAKDLGAAGAAFTTGLLLPYTIINRGRADLAPSLAWQVPRPAEDARLAEQATRGAAYRRALSEYRAMKVPVDERALAVHHGVEVPITAGATWTFGGPSLPTAGTPVAPAAPASANGAGA